MSNIFDFGFTAVNEEELEVVQNAQAKEDEASKKSDSLDDLYNAILPLLSNLKQNPDKDYILWPNRLEKVEEFEAHLKSIYEGK